MPPLPFVVIRAAFGYFLVAFICSIAGYSMSHGSSLPSGAEWSRFLWLGALLLPTYCVRAVLYEHDDLARFLSSGATPDDGRTGHIRSFAIHVAILALLVTSILASVGLPSSRASDWVGLGFAMAPMWLMTLWLLARWPKDTRLYDFRFRSFFPAFATCLPTFLFGYSNGHNWHCIAIGSLLVVAFWLLGLGTRPRYLAGLGAATLASITIVTALTVRSAIEPVQCVRLITFGILMTLAMGVSETWRVTVRGLRGREYRPGSGFGEAESRYYLAGSNVATAVFLPCFIATAIHPSTTATYFYLITAIVIVGYFLWFIDTNPLKSTLWPAGGVVIGLLMPIIISLGANILPAKAVAHLPLDRVPTSVWEVCGSVGVPWTLGWFVEQRVQPLGSWRRKGLAATFVSTTPCIALTSITSGIICGLLVLTATILNLTPGGLSAPVASHFSTLALVYFLMQLICSVTLLLMTWLSNAVKEDDDAHASDIRRDNVPRFVVNTVLSSLQTARPVPSLTAGVMTGVSLLVLGRSDIALAGAIGMTLATMFGFIVNDILDLGKDRAAGVHRPLATGLLSSTQATALAMLAAMGALVSGFSLGSTSGWFMICVLTALLIYTPAAHALPKSKGVYTAILCLSPLAFSATVTSFTLPPGMWLGLAIFIVGRELLLDLADRNADRRWGLRTLAVVLPNRITLLLGYTGMFVGLVSVFSSTNSPLIQAILLLSVSILLLLLASPISLRTQMRWSRLPMILGALSVALSVAR